MSANRLRIGLIPLVDAASLVVAADHGFAVGPLFDAADVAAYVASWCGKKERAIPVRVVR